MDFRFEAALPTDVAHTVVDATVEGLNKAYDVHEALGKSGAEVVRTNAYGDAALAVDVNAEAAVIDTLEATGLPFTVHSEEHGRVELNPHAPGRRLLAVADGLDGSSVYRQHPGRGSYGTMLTVFANDDPHYKDFVAAGIVEHATGRLLFARQGHQLEVNNLKTLGRTYPHARSGNVLSQDDTIAFVDIGPPDASPDHPLHAYFESNYQTFAMPLAVEGIPTIYLGSSAAYYIALATGKADIVGEGTRKGNLEWPTAYAIATTAGGVMLTLDGKDLGQQKFLKFGQTDYQPILTAANARLARKVLAVLTRD